MSVPVDIVARLKTELGGLDTLDDALYRMGMRMRLTGRDLMRLGGVADRFFKRQLSNVLKYLSFSELWTASFEDIRLAIGDIADEVAAVLDPWLTTIADWLEVLADWLSANPWVVYAGGILIVVSAFMILLAKFVTFLGFLNLWVGGIITAHRAALSFGEALTYLIIKFRHGEEAANKYLSTLKNLKGPYDIVIDQANKRIAQLKRENILLDLEEASLKETAKALAAKKDKTKEESIQADIIDKKLAQLAIRRERNKIEIGLLGKRIEALSAAKTKETKVSKKSLKLRDRIWASTKKGAKITLKFGTIAAGLLTLGWGLFLSWEPLMDLFADIGDLLTELLSPLADVIYAIDEWITENPEAAKTILEVILAVLGGIAILSKFGKLTGLVSALTGKFSGILGEIPGPQKAMISSTYKTTLAISALIASLALLFYTLTGFFTALGKMGMGAGEMIGFLGGVLTALLGFLAGLALVSRMFGTFAPGVWKGILALTALIGVVGLLVTILSSLITTVASTEGGIDVLWNVVGAILALAGGMIGLGILAGTLAPVLTPGIAILMGLGLAANLFALALNLVAMAASPLASIFINLLESLKENYSTLTLLVPLLFGLAGGLAAAGLAGLLSFPGLAAAALGIGGISLALTVFAGSVGLLAASIAALAAALASVPDWARDLVGGIIGGIGGVLGGIAGIFKIPGLQRGGYITRSGIAYLHAGETVVPAGYTSTRTEVINYNTFNISGEGLSAREIAEEVSRILAERS